ncbi:aminoglycoside 6'-N-acetyltransferase [Pelagibius sp. Alg239-R121]|uniref:aminoglycoside 6'-N-acetyltransferase n=1 Tax=Pelagibius sp. Alg239-R121 TaxID=2993448 RepID=UPI0024A6AFCE|nr:aminoglycoside 6'-N-acetyltransferase [Pelagibius sp. Alg239-R121]
MPIRIATTTDIEAWAELRVRLWADMTYEQHRDEAAAMLARPSGEFVAFLDLADGTGIRAFAEAALRHDYVNGCQTSPVAYLEGIFVRPENRGAGIGRDLLKSVLSWAQQQGCSELASDADLDNLISHAFHRSLGFEETERVVYFRKLL